MKNQQKENFDWQGAANSLLGNAQEHSKGLAQTKAKAHAKTKSKAHAKNKVHAKAHGKDKENFDWQGAANSLLGN